MDRIGLYKRINYDKLYHIFDKSVEEFFNNMRIIHTSDWHIGKNLYDYSLIEDQTFYFEKFLEQLDELKPDALIIAGDIYDRSIPSAEAINLLGDILCEIVLKKKIQTVLIAGNHDSKDRLSFGSPLLKQSGLHIAGTIEKAIKKVTLQDINFYLIPYIEPHNIKQLYPDQTIKTHDCAMRQYTKEMCEQLDKTQINIAVCHGLFGGGADAEITVGGSEMIDSSIFEEFDYVALGHIHTHRTAGNKNIIYSGSPLKYSIDEATQPKSFAILDITAKHEIALSKVSITPLRDVRILEGSFEYLSNRENFDQHHDYVFMNITDDTIVLNAISRLKAIFPNVIGLKYINLNTSVEVGFIKEKSEVSKLSELDLFENFYYDVTNQRLDELEKSYVETTMNTVKGAHHDTN